MVGAANISKGFADKFLRSINLCLDADEPDRIAHFRPTAKSIPLIRGLLANSKERAFLIIAPYGSGKSLTLTHLVNIVENRGNAQRALEDIEERIKDLSPALSVELCSRRTQRKKGLALTLHGFQENVPKAIQVAALEALRRNSITPETTLFDAPELSSMEDAIEFLEALKKLCIREGHDRLCILWDETGRHLETLKSNGRSAELSDIQLLAEYAARSSDMPITIGLTLHQSILHYAQQMNQSVRLEWQKISGRFEVIQYVDDSKESYRLVAEIVESINGKSTRSLQKKTNQIAKKAKEKNGFFPDFTIDELADVLRRTYPTNPTALYLLPRISARVAQNERTLFTFLYSGVKSESIDIASLYDYFSPSMRSDTTVGGTHKQWIETESAISKTNGDKISVNILKAVCLLSLGIKGERSRVEKATLLFALQGYHSDKMLGKAVDKLIKNKLLLYRRHSKEVSVWHGTDVDLRGHLSEEQDRKRAEFELLGFLNQEVPTEAWKPIEYNTRYGVNRYWSGEYYTSAEYDKLRSDESHMEIPVGCDGKILYLVAETNEELCDARDIAENHSLSDQILVVIPSKILRLREAALEVWCLTQMQHNTDLTGEDPFILPEIKQMLDDARANLQSVLDMLVKPMASGPLWFHKGQPLPIINNSQLRKELSGITESIFPDTPKLHNELINRHKPSGTIVNSRKKLLMGILERHGTSDLGLKATTPDASMFRTILCNTGLYRELPNGKWDYSSGKTQSLSGDIGLKKVWGTIREFFEAPTKDKPKSPEDLFNMLLRPPIGIRRGLLPIFFAAGLKSFAKGISLRFRNEYIADVLPTIIEDVCKNPGECKIEVLELKKDIVQYFAVIHDIFLDKCKLEDETDIVRATYDAIQSWLFQLPNSSLTSTSLTNEAKKFQKLLQKAKKTDPIEFLLHKLPSACGYKYQDLNQVRERVIPLKEELERVSDTYVRKACDVITLALFSNRTELSKTTRQLAKQWAGFFPHLPESGGLPGIAKGLLSRMRTLYDNEALFVNSIASLVVGKSTDLWDDSTAVEFERKIQELVRNIESTAISESKKTVSSDDAQEISDGLANLVTGRIGNLYDQLINLVGEEKSSKLLRNIIKGKTNGHSK